MAYSSPAGVQAFELLAEEVQNLYQRLSALGDENAVLRSRLPEASSGGARDALPPVVPPLPGSLAEAYEANAILRRRFDELSAEQAMTVTWKDEAAKRIQQLSGELEELKRRGPSPSDAPPGGSPLQANVEPTVVEQLRMDVEKSEKNRLGLEKLLSVQNGRVAELSADLEDMERHLREIVLGRDGAVSAAKHPPSQAMVRERTRFEQQERLASEALNAKKESAAAQQESSNLRVANESLKAQIQKLTNQQSDLAREADDLRRQVGEHQSSTSVPGMEEVANRFAKRSEELAEENAKLKEALEQSLPERRQSALCAARQVLEEAGVSVLQIFKALDRQRCGRLPLKIIEAAMKKLPLQIKSEFGKLAKTIWETAEGYKASDGSIVYLEWIQHLARVPNSLLPKGEDLGIAGIDSMSRLRGYSLRTALEAIDEDKDGKLSKSTMKDAFQAFFEFLTKEELDLLIDLVVPEDAADGQIDIMDVVWHLDLAFVNSKAELDALQAKRREAYDLVHGRRPVGNSSNVMMKNPLRALRELVDRREATGEQAALRRIVNLFDHDRLGTVTRPMFKAIIRNEVDENADEEQLDYIFEALDDDADGSIVYPEFERAVMGEDRQRHLTSVLLRLGQALNGQGMRLDDLARVCGMDQGADIEKQQLMEMLLRINYRASDQEIAMLMHELDTTGHGRLCLAELQFRIEAARVDDILGEYKKHLARFGGTELLEALVEIDTDIPGRLNYAQLEGFLLSTLGLQIPRPRVRELFDIFNADHNGTISYQELLQRCGIRSDFNDHSDRECLPSGEGPHWGELALHAVKRAMIKSKRDDETLAQASRRLLTEYDERGIGALSVAQFRRALGGMGLDAGQREVEKLCDILRPGPRDAPQRGSRGQPRGAQQGQQRAARELRVDTLLSRLENMHSSEEEHVAHRLRAKSAIEALRLGLRRRGLSIMALLSDLDPGQHGKVIFDAFRSAVDRYRLGVEADDYARLATALHVDGRGFFNPKELVNLLKRAEETAAMSTKKDLAQQRPDDLGGRMTSAGARGEALEGLPPPTSVSSSTPGRPGKKVVIRSVEAAVENQLAGSVEVKFRKQLDALKGALLTTEQEKDRLAKEVANLQYEAQMKAEEQRMPRPLAVLLAAGDGAPPIVKELKLEVKGTRELRDRLFHTEQELESYKRRLEVDARQEIESERQKSEALRRELEEKERTVAELLFDLRRARGASAEGDWAQREEEFMRLNLQNRKLEEEVSAHKRAENEALERLLEQEHQVMELRFDREQVESHTARLERRILELELLVEGGGATSSASPMKQPVGQAAAAALTVAGRKERNLEHVIEGLERVISQFKSENQRLKQDLDGRKDERKHRAEIEKFRKRISELEAELSSKDSRRGRTGAGSSMPGSAVQASRAEVEEKDRQIAELLNRLQYLEMEVARQSTSAEPDRPPAPASADTEEISRLREELRQVSEARRQDSLALDEAQKALEDAERTERRYLEVARENKRLRTELASLEDEGFWQVIEQLQSRNAEAQTLARESKEVLEQLAAAAPSVAHPTTLIAKLETFQAAAAAA
eukprot:TRINITY_DN455_c0_g2_i1.p1 TRINITY_DN455_c0_g2~~TRINITY_DN455_c0_g2_i1.p1  ORF type:complete len:1580 (-),score=424.29 TRINITY_DN455_c0_g2_i1:582-5279(-)